MAAIVDVYDAITADRVYHKGMSTNDALRKLIGVERISRSTRDLSAPLFRCVSIYPTGTVLELSNEIGPGWWYRLTPYNRKTLVESVLQHPASAHYIDPYTLRPWLLAERKKPLWAFGGYQELRINEMDFYIMCFELRGLFDQIVH